MRKILVLHGVNLDMFGKRDPRHYGHATLADIDAALRGLAEELGVALETFQTNHEGVMVERIHAALADGEAFRHHSVLSAVSAGSIAGFGVDSYLLGLRAACSLLDRQDA